MKPLTKSSALNLAGIREKLKNLQGRKYWRSLEEAAETDEFKEFLHREFPNNASEFRDEVGRREFLKLMAASLALAGLTSCTRQPLQKIVPYVNQPENLTLGRPLFYATAMPHNGFAQGILVTSWEGHPTKIEGNDEHPLSLGATSVFMQAALLDLYDPDRSQAVMRGGEEASQGAFLSMLNEAMQAQKSKKGAGLRILTETVSSPTLVGQLKKVLTNFPEARWHQYQPVNRDHVYEGARLAFGEEVETHHAFEKAEVILSLDADFLFSHPAGLQYTRHFSDGRRASGGRATMNRLYMVETAPTVTGSNADHRLRVKPSEMESIARALAGQGRNRWVVAAMDDLQRHRGASIIIAGDEQSPAVHALAHEMNAKLGNVGKTISYSEALEINPGRQMESLRQLVEDLDAGRVDLLVILGGNPVFNAPADLGFAAHLQRAAQSVHLGVNYNETSALCQWHVPETHFLENWSDARAFDGTVSILQPLIAPLYNGVSAHELIATLSGAAETTAYDLVREHWRSQKIWTDFESSWRIAVHDGIIKDTQLAAKKPRLQTLPVSDNPPATTLEIAFRPDPTLWDGCFANNGWLQELAKPITKVAWDNPALISPSLAEQYHLSNGDIVELRRQGRSLRIPIWIAPGQADQCVTLHLGGGRRQIGRVGSGAGFDTYKLRTTEAFWDGTGVELIKTDEVYLLVSTQMMHNVHSEERQVLRDGSFAEYQKDPRFAQKTSEKPGVEDTLYNPGEHAYAGYKWAMGIDLTTCIGCNACILACQSENNIPVVGKTQVGKGRAMQWIRVDSYYKGNLDNPSLSHMPVPCMHCENAPCELVCPVEATLHDHEGLNLQVYNRCVGTRFCSNNCPYKVRRFNFLFYAKDDYRTPSLKAMLNPEVTVRWRGVMEKCTYCIQRISAARIAAEKEDRRIRDGEITPACAQACPARAIVFGDISDPKSTVSQWREHPLTYDMLGELNTRPRTTYLAKLTNPNPELHPENAE